MQKINKYQNDDIDDDECEDSCKFFTIESTTSSYQLRSFYDQYLKPGKIKLDPLYQRDFTWNSDKQNLLIDSIIRGYIIPNIILRRLKNGTYECVDGQHRLRVIKSFIEFVWINETSNNATHNQTYVRWIKNEYNDGKKEVKNVLYVETDNSKASKIKSKYYLSDIEKDRFDSYQLNVSIITNELTEEQMCNIFARLQNGEKMAGIDKFKNSCKHKLVTYMFDKQLFNTNSLKEEPWKFLLDIYKFKTQGTNKNTTRKTCFVYSIFRFVLLAEKNKLDCGSYLDMNIFKYLEDDLPCVKITKDLDDTFKKLKKFLKNFKDHVEKLCKYVIYILMHLYLSDSQKYNLFMTHIKTIENSKYNNYDTYELNNKKEQKIPSHEDLKLSMDAIEKMIKSIKLVPESDSESDFEDEKINKKSKVVEQKLSVKKVVNDDDSEDEKLIKKKK